MLGPHTSCMTPRPFRPATPKSHALLPQLDRTREWWALAVPHLLDWVWGLCQRPQLRRILHICLIVLGLLVQMVLLLTVAYLCDLALALMELWADLARKHLELTL